MNKKITVIISLIVILINLIPISSNAVTPINEAYVYATKQTEYLLKWKEIEVNAHMAVYKVNGKEYPAYCMNRGIPGVEVGISQTVDVNQLVSNVQVWRAVINGYPYKTISELGCKTEEEAYLATKQAVYTILLDRDVNEYSVNSGHEGPGTRALNALKQIVKAARTSTVTKVSSELTVKQKNSLWQTDSLDNKYVSQVFSVTANAPFSKYTVELKNLDIEGVKVTDKNNKEKKEFNSNEEFKILMPITNITKDGNFSINVSGQVETKPVFYGKARSTGLQNYALTGYTYEDGTGAKKVYYTKNQSKIVIVKKDSTGNNFLQGVEFELLDANKNVLYTGLTTNENGQIEVENLLPGTYYIKETRTQEGYELYNELIEVELELNEVVTVNVINSEEEPNIEINKKETELSVKESESKKTIEIPKAEVETPKTEVKLPKTGM